MKRKSKGFFQYLGDLTAYIALPISLGGGVFLTTPSNAIIVQQASTLASISATLLGFIIAAVAVIVSVDNQTLIKNLKHYGYYDNLIKSMMWSGFFLFLTTIMAFSIGFLPNLWQFYAIVVSIVVAALSMVFFVSASRKLWLVLSILAKHNES